MLQGFPWERGQPAVIECEFEDTKTVPLGYTFHDLARFLVERGYTVYVSEWHPIIRYGIRHDWRALMRYPCELADPKGWGNLLAFRDGIDEELLVRTVKAQIKTKPSSPPSKAPKIKQPESSPAPGTLSIRTVNRLERDGEYQQALKMCEQLQQQRSLKIDQLTAERLRRKLAQVS